jgi:hypothetical protein
MNGFNETLGNSTDFRIIWETILSRMGSSIILDTLYLYFITTLSFLSFILNGLSFAILLKLNEKQAIYKYYKVYTFFGAIISLILVLSFYSRCPRYFNFTFSFTASLFRCQLSGLGYGLGTFITLINISIMAERVSYFKPKFASYFKNRAYRVSFICFISGFLVNLPTIFMAEARSTSYYLMAFSSIEKANEFVYCPKSSLSNTVHGRIIILVSAIIKNIVFLITEIILTMISLYYLKKFFKKKKKLVNNNIVDKSLELSHNHKSSQKVIASHEIQLSRISMSENKNEHLITNNSKIEHPNSKSRQKGTSLGNQSNRRITRMSLIFASLSIFTNFSSLLTSITFIMNSDSFLYQHVLFINISIALVKLCSNFFIFYFYNNNFKSFFSIIKI